MAEPLVIIGAGGFGRETADVVEAVNAATLKPTWELLGIVDDAPAQINIKRLERRKIEYLGSVDDLTAGLLKPRYVVGIGSPRVRESIADRLDAAGFEAATLIHPDATVGSCSEVGEGTIVLAGARVTTNVILGRHVQLNPNATVGHDTVLEDFVSMNPGSSVSGDCVVKTGVLIGVGAVVLNQLTLGAGSLVGGSACVVRDVAAGRTVKGVPAR